jgi:hypothetical protein
MSAEERAEFLRRKLRLAELRAALPAELRAVLDALMAGLSDEQKALLLGLTPAELEAFLRLTREEQMAWLKKRLGVRANPDVFVGAVPFDSEFTKLLTATSPARKGAGGKQRRNQHGGAAFAGMETKSVCAVRSRAAPGMAAPAPHAATDYGDSDGGGAMGTAGSLQQARQQARGVAQGGAAGMVGMGAGPGVTPGPATVARSGNGRGARRAPRRDGRRKVGFLPRLKKPQQLLSPTRSENSYFGGGGGGSSEEDGGAVPSGVRQIQIQQGLSPHARFTPHPTKQPAHVRDDAFLLPTEVSIRTGTTRGTPFVAEASMV